MASELIHGTVKWYNPDKAYGFLSMDGGQDVFVHRNAIADGRPWLVDGQQVSFRLRQGMKGMEAEDVRVTQDVERIPPARARFYADEPRRDTRPRFGDRPRREREPYRGPLPAGPVDATIVRMDPAGRFMFVRAEAEGFDVYVHSSLFATLHYRLREGDHVRITVEQSDRGLRAQTIESVNR